MGVSGSGKTTVGILLSQQTGIPFFDGDDFHSPANKTKMGAGTPLTDEDRISWLNTLHQLALDHSPKKGAIIACSALKEKYRLILSEGLIDNLKWIVLKGGYDLIHERMMRRKDHYMPAGLLQSQFEAMEYPDYGQVFDIDASPALMVKAILDNESKSEFGLMGLGVMGKSLARNLGQKGFRLSLYNIHLAGKEEKVAEQAIQLYNELSQALGFDEVSTFVNSLSIPRKIFLMVPAGKPVDQVIQQLIPLLNPGDIIMDGGNSHYEDTNRRAQQLSEYKIHYLGIGVSGGEQGALTGPSIMPGGSPSAYPLVSKFLEAIAARDSQGQACCTYIGKGGAGHFVKMIHNGIEYAEMQLLAEIYWIFKNGMHYTAEQTASVFESWNKEEARSYLMDITIKILRRYEDGHLVLDTIADIGGSKGTGGWSLNAAAQLGQPANLISEALFARFISTLKNERVQAHAAMKNHPDRINYSETQIRKAYDLARLINHHQGLQIIRAASTEYHWNLDLAAITRIWTNGCIIRSALMENLSQTLKDNPNILLARMENINTTLPDLIVVVNASLQNQLAVPCLSAGLNFILSYTSAESPVNLLQAQRDFFGAHTYRRKDDPSGKSYHTIWE